MNRTSSGVGAGEGAWAGTGVGVDCAAGCWPEAGEIPPQTRTRPRKPATRMGPPPLFRFGPRNLGAPRDIPRAGGDQPRSAVITTTSLVVAPLENATHLPSRDQSKKKIGSAVHLVNWREGPP